MARASPSIASTPWRAQGAARRAALSPRGAARSAPAGTRPVAGEVALPQFLSQPAQHGDERGPEPFFGHAQLHPNREGGVIKGSLRDAAMRHETGLAR